MIACRVPIDQVDVDRLSLRTNPVRIRDAVRSFLAAGTVDQALAYLDLPATPRSLKVALGAELDQAVRRFAARRVGLTRAAVVRAAVAAYGPGAQPALEVVARPGRIRSTLMRNVGIRVDNELYAALEADAAAHHQGSIATAARFHLETALLAPAAGDAHNG